jgi:SprT protein
MLASAHRLHTYLPEAAVPIIDQWIQRTKCRFRIAPSRKTKLGDYRAPHQGQPHQISINKDLNPYAFLVTTVHEFAHLVTWEIHQNKVKPHGQEWKNNFKTLMQPFLNMNLLPQEIQFELSRYMANPAASSCTHLPLQRALKRYDLPIDPQMSTVEQLPVGTRFKWRTGQEFIKKEKVRKRYRCMEIGSNRVYLFNPLAEVKIISA